MAKDIEKQFKFVELDDKPIKINISNVELVKVLNAVLEAEQQIHNLTNREKGLVTIGVIKGMAHIGIFANPFVCMELVNDVNDYGKITEKNN